MKFREVKPKASPLPRSLWTNSAKHITRHTKLRTRVDNRIELAHSSPMTSEASLSNRSIHKPCLCLKAAEAREVVVLVSNRLLGRVGTEQS